MLLLAAIPVLVGLLVRANGNGVPHVGATLDGLVIRIVLPLVALVFGTAALGSELEDGTAVHLLTKPIRRSTIVLAKIAVAGIPDGGAARAGDDPGRDPHRRPGFRRRGARNRDGRCHRRPCRLVHLRRDLRGPQRRDESRADHRPRLRAHLGRGCSRASCRAPRSSASGSTSAGSPTSSRRRRSSRSSGTRRSSMRPLPSSRRPSSPRSASASSRSAAATRTRPGARYRPARRRPRRVPIPRRR